MPKPINVIEVNDLVEDLELANKESQKKITLYEECITKGMHGFTDLVTTQQAEIRRNDRLILLLKHPEVNPLLSFRFEISPKVFGRRAPRNAP